MAKIVIEIIRVERRNEDKRNNTSQESSSVERIVEKSGRKLTECQCEQCKSQCRTPCLGTPEDILRLIKAGYMDKVAITDWAFGMAIGEIPFPIRMVQPIKMGKGCVFFKDGLCELHTLGLKPTEGKLSHHTLQEENLNFRKSLTWNVAKEWIDTRNIPIIVEIILRLGKRK
jgi:hypothetical protein